jgi:hypothetical protein
VKVCEIKERVPEPIKIVRNNDAIKKILIPEVKKETVKVIVVKKIEPIKVVRSNCSKELVIVKKNQEIIVIPAIKKEIKLEEQATVIEKEEGINLEKKTKEMGNIIAPANVEVNVLRVGETNAKKKEPLVFNFGMSDRRNIEVKLIKKVDYFEEVPET